MPVSLHTKKIFADSLKELMCKTSLEDISVGDIAAHCDMSRNAFYYHFQDKYDLVNWIFRTESAQYFAEAQTVTRENWADIILSFCDYFKVNHVFYCNALAYTGQNSLQEYLTETIADLIVQHIRDLRKPEYRQWSDKEIAFAGDFFSIATVGLLVKWSRNGMAEDASLYRNCLSRILSGRMIEDYLDNAS